jgi:ubiquinone/menaquinone biosynthesis C-methylase UbiE
MSENKDLSCFWNSVARRYAAMSMHNQSCYAATLARIRTHRKPTDRVLELGCGTTTIALRLAHFVTHYTATDYSAGRSSPSFAALFMLFPF